MIVQFKRKKQLQITKINFGRNDLADSFFNTLKNSNFLVLKCYKLVFSKKGQINNKGSYLMPGITAIFIVLLIIYVINGNKKLDAFIQKYQNQKGNLEKQKSIKVCH